MPATKPTSTTRRITGRRDRIEEGREGEAGGLQVGGWPAVAAEEREEGGDDAGEEENDRGHPEPHGGRGLDERSSPHARLLLPLSLAGDRLVGEGDATGQA